MAIPKIPTRESHIEAYLVKCAKAAGGEVRKVQWIGRAGATDRVILTDGDEAAVDLLYQAGVDMPDADMARLARGIVAAYIKWPELKAPGKKPEPHQVREHERMRRVGQRVEVIDSYEGVEALFK